MVEMWSTPFLAQIPPGCGFALTAGKVPKTTHLNLQVDDLQLDNPSQRLPNPIVGHKP